MWRKGFNCELYDLYEDIDLVRELKINILRWAGHVARMDPNNPVKRIFSANPEGKRKVGRPKTRWLDCVERDLEAMGVRNWKNKAIDSNQWQGILKQAKTRPGLMIYMGAKSDWDFRISDLVKKPQETNI